jgi:hypothetical protein
MMLLDEPLVSLFDGRIVRAGVKPQDGKCGRSADHGRTV